jgi:hypothetical protein
MPSATGRWPAPTIAEELTWDLVRIGLALEFLVSSGDQFAVSPDSPQQRVHVIKALSDSERCYEERPGPVDRPHVIIAANSNAICSCSRSRSLSRISESRISSERWVRPQQSAINADRE